MLTSTSKEIAHLPQEIAFACDEQSPHLSVLLARTSCTPQLCSAPRHPATPDNHLPLPNLLLFLFLFLSTQPRLARSTPRLVTRCSSLQHPSHTQQSTLSCVGGRHDGRHRRHPPRDHSHLPLAAQFNTSSSTPPAPLNQDPDGSRLSPAHHSPRNCVTMAALQQWSIEESSYGDGDGEGFAMRASESMATSRNHFQLQSLTTVSRVSLSLIHIHIPPPNLCPLPT